MQPTQSGCQLEGAPAFSRLSRPYPVFLIWRAWWRWRNNGFFPTLRKAVTFGWEQLRQSLGGGKSRAVARNGAVARATLDLQPGELVEVKSEHEILEMLDQNRTTNGLVFLPGMKRYCGSRFRVFKRLEKMLLEESKQIRRLKATVLLDGAMCDGEGIGCDRSCFYFWREAWLRRVHDGSTAVDTPN